MKKLFFDLGSVPHDKIRVGNITFGRDRKSTHLVCESKAFFTCLKTESFVLGVIGLLNASERFTWEHASPVMLGEDSPATNILKSLSRNAITINRLNNAFCGPDCFFGRRLFLINQVIGVPFKSLSQRLSPLMISSGDFSSFIVVLDLAEDGAE